MLNRCVLDGFFLKKNVLRSPMWFFSRKGEYWRNYNGLREKVLLVFNLEHYTRVPVRRCSSMSKINAHDATPQINFLNRAVFKNPPSARSQRGSDGTSDKALLGPKRWPRSTDWLILMSAHVSNVPIGWFLAILEPSQSGHLGSTRAGKTWRAGDDRMRDFPGRCNYTKFTKVIRCTVPMVSVAVPEKLQIA